VNARVAARLKRLIGSGTFLGHFWAITHFKDVDYEMEREWCDTAISDLIIADLRRLFVDWTCSAGLTREYLMERVGQKD
jgi:hypothetical protein